MDDSYNNHDKEPGGSPFEPKAGKAETEDVPDYEPYQVYNYERAHVQTYYDEDGHHIPPPKRRPNNLAMIALYISVSSVALCCCSPYAGIAASIMGITLAVCSRFFNNPEQKFYGQSIAAIIISVIALIGILGSIGITYILIPYLIETYPEFEEYYNQVYRSLLEQFQETQTAVP